MEMGSDYVWDLNKNPPRSGIDYITLAGTRDYYYNDNFPETCLYDYWDTTDGVVDYRSASLLNYNIPLVTIYRSHTSIFNYFLWFDWIGINTHQTTKDIIYEDN